MIQGSQKPRDQAIYKKWCKDRELDEYAKTNGMKLIRITDEEFKVDPKKCLLKVRTS